MSDLADTDSKHWTLDKKIPVALILAMLGQFAAGVWVYATLTAHVARLQADQLSMSVQVDQLRAGRENSSARITGLEATSVAIDRRLERIEVGLDRVVTILQGK